PLWGYRLAVAGMLGVTLLSFMVWQHHLFVSGMNAGLRPFYMLTTELISIPTGFIFLNAIGTLWRARIRFTVPMLFALAFLFVFFNLPFFPLFAAGFLDMPRRVSTYAPHLQVLNDFVSASAFMLGFSMLIFIANLVWSLVFARVPALANPWASRGLEWQLPT